MSAGQRDWLSNIVRDADSAVRYVSVSLNANILRLSFLWRQGDVYIVH